MKRAMTLALLMLAACGDDADGDRVEAILALDGDEVAGATGYAGSCAGCHGANGEGVSAPPMADVVGIGDDLIVDAIINGVGGMPSIDLEDQEVADILAYVTATF